MYRAVVAVDFDGTITHNSPYPVIGRVRKEIKPFLEKMITQGYSVVLNTCRVGKYYNEAVQALKDNELYNLFDWEYATKQENKGTNGKLVAAFYLDDSAMPFDDLDYVNWNTLTECVIEKIEQKLNS